MGQTTEISWCDHTFNCWWGCTKVGNSPACTNCYAETWAKRTGFQIWGDDAERRYFGEKHWVEPLKWNRKAEADGVKRRVFCMSMGDWAEGRPEQREHLERLWDLMPQTPNLIWLMLTKRPQLIRKLYPFGTLDNPPLGVWQGVTAETQNWLNLRWPILRAVPSEVYWLSIEPLFEKIVLPHDFLELGQRAWVIVGGESGGSARPMNPEWARSLRDQCNEANVPFHFKQWGAWTPDAPDDFHRISKRKYSHETFAWGKDGNEYNPVKPDPDDFPKILFRVGKKAAGCLLDGQEWKQFPESHAEKC